MGDWPGWPLGSSATKVFVKHSAKYSTQLLDPRLLASSKDARHNADFVKSDIYKLHSARTAHRGCWKGRVTRTRNRKNKSKKEENERKKKNLSHNVSELLLYTITSEWDTFMELLWFYSMILTMRWDVLVFYNTFTTQKFTTFPTTYQHCICRKLSELFSYFAKYRCSIWFHLYGLKLKDPFLRKLKDQISYLAAAGLTSQHVAHLTTSV